jgi:hypothetical protein
MILAILITIAITAPVAALATSWVEDKKQYNLWDWLKDKVNAIRGRVVYAKQITIKVAASDLKHVEDAILGMPDRIKAYIRRRL